MPRGPRSRSSLRGLVCVENKSVVMCPASRQERDFETEGRLPPLAMIARGHCRCPQSEVAARKGHERARIYTDVWIALLKLKKGERSEL